MKDPAKRLDGLPIGIVENALLQTDSAPPYDLNEAAFNGGRVASSPR